MPSTPDRKTSEAELNQFNQQLRASPLYAQFMSSQGLVPGRAVKLSRRQQGQFEDVLRAHGVPIPSGMHIDNAGNLNQKNRLARNIGIAAAATGLALTGAGAAGIGPLSGLGAGATGAAGAAGAIPSVGATGGIAAGAFPAIAGTTGASLAGAAIPSLGVTSGLAAGAFPTVAGTSGAGMAGSSGIMSGITKAAQLYKNGRAATSLASGLAGAAQSGREADNAAASGTANFEADQAGAANRDVLDRADLDLKRRLDARLGQSDAYEKAIQGALGKNIQDVHMDRPSGIPNISFTGGSRPSAIGPEGRAAASELNKQAMLKLMSGESYDPLPAFERVNAPEYKKPGLFENVAGAAGMAGQSYFGAKDAAEQSSYQRRILEAIESMSRGGR